ncbi:MAG: enoyl-CoA hydratase-related protein, partial [Pseudomonadota bacterium]
MSDPILVTREGAVQIIRFNRPEKKNAITNQMYTTLVDTLEAAEADEAVSVHVLLGHPGVFTAGNDMGDFLAVAQTGATAERPVARYLKLQPEIKKPMIAAV